MMIPTILCHYDFGTDICLLNYFVLVGVLNVLLVVVCFFQSRVLHRELIDWKAQNSVVFPTIIATSPIMLLYIVQVDSDLIWYLWSAAFCRCFQLWASAWIVVRDRINAHCILYFIDVISSVWGLLLCISLLRSQSEWYQYICVVVTICFFSMPLLSLVISKRLSQEISSGTGFVRSFENVLWCQHLFFSWLSALLHLGARNSLNLDDLPQLPERDMSEIQYKTFVANLECVSDDRKSYAIIRETKLRYLQTQAKFHFRESKSDSSSCCSRIYHWFLSKAFVSRRLFFTYFKFPNLLQFLLPQDDHKIAFTEQAFNDAFLLIDVFYRSFSGAFVRLGLLKLISVVLSFSGPFILKMIVDFIESNGSEDNKNSRQLIVSGARLVILVAGTMLVSALVSVHYSFDATRVQLRIRSALIPAVFHKSLSLTLQDFISVQMNSGSCANIMSVDCQTFVGSIPNLHDTWSVPLQVGITLYFLYFQVRFAFVAGLVVLVIMIPLNMKITRKISQISQTMMHFKDVRAEVCEEALHGIKAIKFGNLESWFLDRVSDARRDEMSCLSKRKYLDAWCVFFWASTPLLVSFVTFGACVSMGQELSASKIFTAQALLNMLIWPLNAYPWVINGTVEALVSFIRISRLLFNRSTFDGKPRNKKDSSATFASAVISWIGSDRVYISNERSSSDSHTSGDDGDDGYSTLVDLDSTFASTKEDSENPSFPLVSLDDSEVEMDIQEQDRQYWRNFRYCDPDRLDVFKLSISNLTIPKGKVIAVCGSVGSGKSTLFCSLLGEIVPMCGKFVQANCKRFPILYSFSPQSGIVLNLSIKENIIFGDDLNQARFYEAISCCCLNRDMVSLIGLDGRTVGERGQKLSGGQKSRVSIARALYANSCFVVLDDPFGNLDFATANEMYAKIVKFLRSEGRTLIFSSNSIHFCSLADSMIAIKDGEVEYFASMAEFTSESDVYQDMVSASESKEKTLDDSDFDHKTSDPVYVEEIAPSHDTEVTERLKRGSLSWGTWMIYFKASGCCLVLLVILTMALMQGGVLVYNFWLAKWSVDSSTMSPSEFWLQFGIIVSVVVLVVLARSFIFAKAGIVAAKSIFNRLIGNIASSPLPFFETGSIGNLLNRLTVDTFIVDDNLPFMLNIVLAQSFGLLGILVLLSVSVPVLMPVIFLFMALYFRIQSYYRCSSRELRRIEAACRSPLFTLFSECADSMVVIRSNHKIMYFMGKSHKLVDDYSRTSFSTSVASQWLTIRLQVIGSLICLSICIIAVLNVVFRDDASMKWLSMSPSVTGLALSFAISIVGNLNSLVSSFSDTEKEMVSVERISEFFDISQENVSQVDVPEYLHGWPRKGEVSFRNVWFAYDPTKSIFALRGVTFQVKSGEKVAILGRTGAGKSSLLRALLRTEGGNVTPAKENSGVYIDDINVGDVSLSHLRRSVVVLPQEPFVFGGTVRSNIDPEATASMEILHRAVIWCHLRECLMQKVESPTNERECNEVLDFVIRGKGSNLSVGQSQLICIARAMIRDSSVMIFDECTEKLDLVTESYVRNAMKSVFAEKTVIMIIHRKETAQSLCQRSIVIDAGEIKKS